MSTNTYIDLLLLSVDETPVQNETDNIVYTPYSIIL